MGNVLGKCVAELKMDIDKNKIIVLEIQLRLDCGDMAGCG